MEMKRLVQITTSYLIAAATGTTAEVCDATMMLWNTNAGNKRKYLLY
jgi:hypothetical protein